MRSFAELCCWPQAPHLTSKASGILKQSNYLHPALAFNIRCVQSGMVANWKLGLSRCSAQQAIKQARTGQLIYNLQIFLPVALPYKAILFPFPIYSTPCKLGCDTSLMSSTLDLTCMLSWMSDEWTRDCKGFPTGVTDIRLFSCMSPHMICQCACLCKSLPTSIADIWLFSTVLPKRKGAG